MPPRIRIVKRASGDVTTRRGLPRKAKAKGAQYNYSHSSEAGRTDSGTEGGHESPSPEGAQNDAPPEAAQNNNNSNNNNTPPEPGWWDHSSNFTPDFWNNLSHVWLTTRGLREVDRRNGAMLFPVPQRPAIRPRSIARWAMHGGPDTRHLRGYKRPEERHLFIPPAKPPLKGHPRPEPLSAYDSNLAQHLADNGIYLAGEGPSGIVMPSNIDKISEWLHRPYPALGPKTFTQAHWARWKDRTEKAQGDDVMKKLFRPIIGGTGGLRARNLQFHNLEPLVEGDAPVIPAPTAFDGSPAASIDPGALQHLSRLIRPVEDGEWVAPNFFLQATNLRPLMSSIEERRACYHGAYGARAMHAMQNYGGEETLYDGAAYAFSATWTFEGILTLYANHMRPPREPDGRPEYHMTALGAWNMKSSRAEFARGAGAFRNLLELATEYRDDFVAEVNVSAPP